jgi:large subunit ribosomal protein L10
MVASIKVDMVSELTEKLRRCQSVVVTDFKGITVHDVTLLRSQLRAQSVEMRVIKNRLIKRALAEVGFDAIDSALTGNTAIAISYGEPAAPAKVLLEAAKKNDKLVIKGGLLEGKALDAAGVEALSKMPGRKELLARMAGDFKQPATKMASVFQAGLLKVAYAMNALAEKRAA